MNFCFSFVFKKSIELNMFTDGDQNLIGLKPTD